MTAYEAVPPGRYRFRVLAANGDGVWNEAGASLAVEVVPHYWETRAFRFLALCAAIAMAAALGWAIARRRMKRRLARLELQRAREAERARIARDLHDDLGASLTEISMLAHLAVEDREHSRGADEPLTQIAQKAQSLVGALDEIVWAVNPRQDTVASLADYLAGSAREFLENAGIALRLDVPRALPDTPLDAESRHGLFLAVREAMNNAAKHSGATELRLRVLVRDHHLEIVIEDNGHGFTSDADERGDGFRNIRDRLAGLGGECSIETTPGCGTTVRLHLPLQANHSA